MDTFKAGYDTLRHDRLPRPDAIQSLKKRAAHSFSKVRAFTVSHSLP